MSSAFDPGVAEVLTFAPAAPYQKLVEQVGITYMPRPLGGSYEDIRAEFVCAVMVDRISHEYAVYRAFLKNAALTGTQVINNPFWWSADDKRSTSLPRRAGVALAGRQAGGDPPPPPIARA
ncbi:MAG: hypothetical protein M3Y50_13540 [Acidobacteriota bacterium]|nr:hypothetical protein [Acidobacteriota bacterium]